MDGKITTYTYYPDGKKDTITYPNSTTVKYTYYNTNRVATIVNKNTADNTIISSYEYQYDANGNRTQQIEVQNSTTETTTYNFDIIDRLTDFTVTDNTNTTITEYTYNGYNRETETVTENSTVTKNRTYHYNSVNWLTSIDDANNASTITYTYDNNGNTISKTNSSLTEQDTTFTYDARNQLVETRQGPPGSETVIGQYDYNAGGLRVRHRYSERGDVDYYYDGNAVLEERNATDDTLLAHYRYADRLLSLDTGSGTQYYHHDALGSTVNLTNDSGAVQVSYKLDPFGQIREQTGTSVNRQIFTGQEHDENTGLIYFGARYYDPDIGRFITQDSYLGESSIPPSLHRYLYAYSNPTVYIDLYGYNSSNLALKIVSDAATQSASEAAKRRAAFKVIEGGGQALAKASRFTRFVAPATRFLGWFGLAAWAGHEIGENFVGPALYDSKISYDEWLTKESSSGSEDYEVTHVETYETVIATPDGFYTSQGKKVSSGAVADWSNRRSRESLPGGGVVAESYSVWQEEQDVVQNDEDWEKPKGWILPQQGTWSGEEGDSYYYPSNYKEVGLAAGQGVKFEKGSPVFSSYAVETMEVPGLTGEHKEDMPAIQRYIAEQKGWFKKDGTPNASAAAKWLRKEGLIPHHAGGNTIELIPEKIHGNRKKGLPGISHTGGGYRLRNQDQDR